MARDKFAGYINEEPFLVSAEVEEKLLYGQGSFPVGGKWTLTDWRIEVLPDLPDGTHKLKVIAHGPHILDVEVHNRAVVSVKTNL